ncbi:uncharacterized protein LOC128812256 [Vidua macroura]|uniref:uncharacterized protein LOC128812256 n=1 Tax=Vidua macroura TaxID=187451 RepID=UPI0023A7962C|nr:uncharacterized protein LOC128812256 [Vidua macroura]
MGVPTALRAFSHQPEEEARCAPSEEGWTRELRPAGRVTISQLPLRLCHLQRAQILAHRILAHWNLAHRAFSCSPWRGSISSPHKQFSRQRCGQAVQSRPSRAHQGCTASGSGLNGAWAVLAQAPSALPAFRNSWRHHHLCRYLFVARVRHVPYHLNDEYKKKEKEKKSLHPFDQSHHLEGTGETKMVRKACLTESKRNCLCTAKYSLGKGAKHRP